MTRSKLKALLIAVVLLLLLFTMVTFTWMTDTFIELWLRLQELPPLAQGIYFGLLALIAALFLWLTWWLIKPSGRSVNAKAETVIQSEEELESRLGSARKEGVDTTAIDAELQELRRRKEAGSIHVAVFGEISSGKSSLIRSMLPDADVETDVTGGTTRNTTEYTWESPAGDRLIIIDMPGLNEAGRELDILATEEAQRSHIVLFVTDGDITRSQYDSLLELQRLKKPLMIVLNKSDWYSMQQLDQIRHSLEKREDLAGTAVVIVTAEHEESITRIDANGEEHQETRMLPAETSQLERGLQRLLDSHREILDQLRDTSVFVLAGKKLDEAVAEERNNRASLIVSDYSRKAVVGGLAAVTPGTDLLIQGFLGTRMVRELSELYEIPVRDVDTELLMSLVQRHVGTAKTVILAVAGNGLKAFPGMGTVTGGVLHAVAYGMIFYSLGHAVSESLRSRGELRPLVADALFKERFEADMKQTAKRFASYAYKSWKDKSK